MQQGTELVVLSGVLTILLSSIMSVFLGRKWYKQEVRLMTDLPLVFAISGICQAVNSLILTLPNIGLLELTLELFRLRSLVIGGAIVPILGAILQIWTPSYQKYHTRTVILLTMYWFSIALLGPSEAIIMILTIPILLVISFTMMITFIITWKTGRLKEVRSELLIAAVLFMIASQILRVPFMSTSLFYIPDLLIVATMFCMAVGIANPWYSRETKSLRKESPQMVQIAE
ncbi:MAG: hypothetical protein E3J86_13505 [Candidatus Thorarchaeota archaeon]|nr:MAG: hypothetical protein E3J86_13505 [Candidatus Thorarchaeota archaeon]